MGVHICTCAHVNLECKHGHTCYLSFISVAVIKYSDKSNLGEKGSVLAYDSYLVIKGRQQVAELEAAGDIHSQEQSGMHAY